MGYSHLGEGMKILVTGATSMIGRVTVMELLRRGHSVNILQRGDSDLPVTVFRGDIRDSSAVVDAMRGCDVAIHAAAKVGLVGSYREFYDINVGGTQNVLEAAKHSGCQGVVYVSSPSVSYSKTPVNGEVAPPARDDVLGHYSKTKSLAEQLVLSESSLSTVALRPHLVWGPGDTQLVGRIIERARQGRLVLVNKGSALVDSTYIDNVGDALVVAAERIGTHENLKGRALVVSNGEPRSVAQLVESICTSAQVPFAPKSIRLRPAVILGKIIESVFAVLPGREPPLTAFTAYQLGISHWFDISETYELLEWKPRVSLDDGFAALAASFGGP